MMLMNNKFFLMTPLNLSYLWNIGSLLMLMMIMQIMTGLMLTLYYENSEVAFLSVWKLHMEVFMGALIHFLHMNFASWIFFFLYLHMFKALIFSSFVHLKIVWSSGFILMLLLMMIAFMGYVLPWGQMSLWGATVICNLLTTIPFLGVKIVQWIWGGYFVSNITLKLFFSMHFLMPLILIIFMMSHIIFLHLNGSSNPIGSISMLMKGEFMNSFLIKDSLNLFIMTLIILIICYKPYLSSDSENFLMANSMISPVHIQPEWYFLSYYAILRAIPNKLGGVLCFIFSIMLFLLVIFKKSYQSLQIFKMWMFYYCLFFMFMMMLIFLGGCPVEYPYFMLSQMLTFAYFLWFILVLI